MFKIYWMFFLKLKLICGISLRLVCFKGFIFFFGGGKGCGVVVEFWGVKSVDVMDLSFFGVVVVNEVMWFKFLVIENFWLVGIFLFVIGGGYFWFGLFLKRWFLEIRVLIVGVMGGGFWRCVLRWVKVLGGFLFIIVCVINEDGVIVGDVFWLFFCLFLCGDGWGDCLVGSVKVWRKGFWGVFKIGGGRIVVIVLIGNLNLLGFGLLWVCWDVIEDDVVLVVFIYICFGLLVVFLLCFLLFIVEFCEFLFVWRICVFCVLIGVGVIVEIWMWVVLFFILLVVIE